LARAREWSEWKRKLSPEERGRGVGNALLDAVEAELERPGIGDVIIGAVPSNTNVLETYR
jgi:ribosomal protein S18 acetylase RimI-like enzyme